MVKKPVIISICCLMVVLTGLFHAKILIGLAGFLIVDDPLVPADALVMLNGEVETRPFHAADLFHRKMAPLILVAKTAQSPPEQLGILPNTADVAIDVMKKLGVSPKDAVRVDTPDGVTSTWDEALALREYIRTRPIRQIIVVTSAFHTRRTAWTFKKVFDGLPVSIRMSAAPQWGFEQTNWWGCEEGLISFCNEYIKMMYYLVVY